MSDEVRNLLHQLQQTLPYVPPISTDALLLLHRRRDYNGMVQLIRKTMNIGVRLRVGWVNKGGPEAPAWVKLPDPMPFYGSKAFREMTISVFFRKSFLEQSTYDQVAIAVAHELSHIVLESIAHPLRKEEKAVDLAAMLLGFRRLYEVACYKELRVENTATYRKLGYLSLAEVEFANQLLAQSHLPLRSSIMEFIMRQVRKGWFSRG